jgi:hypothetical protein
MRMVRALAAVIEAEAEAEAAAFLQLRYLSHAQVPAITLSIVLASTSRGIE